MKYSYLLVENVWWLFLNSETRAHLNFFKLCVEREGGARKRVLFYGTNAGSGSRRAVSLARVEKDRTLK